MIFMPAGSRIPLQQWQTNRRAAPISGASETPLLPRPHLHCRVELRQVTRQASDVN